MVGPGVGHRSAHLTPEATAVHLVSGHKPWPVAWPLACGSRATEAHAVAADGGHQPLQRAPGEAISVNMTGKESKKQPLGASAPIRRLVAMVVRAGVAIAALRTAWIHVPLGQLWS
jgi:hypothetical protein